MHSGTDFGSPELEEQSKSSWSGSKVGERDLSEGTTDVATCRNTMSNHFMRFATK